MGHLPIEVQQEIVTKKLRLYVIDAHTIARETGMGGRIPADFALTSGVHTAKDVLKAMMAGASVTMTASALLRHGSRHLSRTLADLQEWMIVHEYASMREMQGSMSQQAVAEPAAFERVNYLKALNLFDPFLP